MDILIIVLSVIVSLLLIGVVLIQKSKGGGLSSSFAGSYQIMGVRRTTDFIKKTHTKILFIIKKIVHFIFRFFINIYIFRFISHKHS